tara:strand:+ start:417 stop:815 length:399 start_codon:yes stop_codon:yes gene_type:complete
MIKITKSKIEVSTSKYTVSIYLKKKINYITNNKNYIIGFFGEMIDKRSKKIKLDNAKEKLLSFKHEDAKKIKNFLSNYFGSFSFFYLNIKKNICLLANDRFGLNHIFYTLKKKNKFHLKVSDYLDQLIEKKK